MGIRMYVTDVSQPFMVQALGLQAGEDTKIGGSGMVMAIAGAALLTQIQGVQSDR